MTIEKQGVSIILTDAEGRILLQHRDSAAWVAPDKWCIPGGGVDADELPTDAARRELCEETGILLGSPPQHLWSQTVDEALEPGTSDPYIEHIFHATTTCRDEEVQVNEGRAMRFISAEVITELDMADSSRHFLEKFFKLHALGTSPKTVQPAHSTLER